MGQIRVFMLLLAFLGLSLSTFSFAEGVSQSSAGVVYTSPVGYWQTVDDETGAAKSIVKIFTHEGKLYGRIMQINYPAGKGPDELCTKCTGVRQTQPILGMIFMWGLSPDPKDATEWSGGQILDPKNGTAYSDQLTLTDQGKTLTVLGYVGTKFLGRTQIWHRLPDNALAAFPSSVIAKGSDENALRAVEGDISYN